MDREPGCPPPQGLYDPSHEKDACGVGFVVHVKGVRSHAIVKQALQLLVNLLHRGACGCEVNTGDGAGILIQMPDAFLRKEARSLGISLPPAANTAPDASFCRAIRLARATIEALVEKIVDEEGQTLLGWRDLPTDDRLGRRVRPAAVRRTSSRSSSGSAPRLKAQL
jgi:glutamate synthase domain-containing protein 1